MTGFWIALAIVAGIILFCIVFIILLLLFGRVKIRITYIGGLRAVASVLGIPLKVYPEKDENEKKRSRTERCRSPKKALMRELRRLEKQKKADEKEKRKKAHLQAKRKRKRARRRKGDANAQPAPRLVESLSDITNLIKKLYKIARKGLKIHVKKMHIYVATEDAAKTAVVYGVVLQSVAYLLQFIETRVLHIRRDEGAMEIVADYLSQSSHAEIDIICYVLLSKVILSGVLGDADLIPKQKKTPPKSDDTQVG